MIDNNLYKKRKKKSGGEKIVAKGERNKKSLKVGEIKGK